MRIPRPLVLAAVGVTLIAAACGDDDSTTTDADGSGEETRTVEVEMVDIAFEPDTLEVVEGETVRFVFTNAGELPHDAFVGDEAAQAEHEEEMREAEGNEHGGHGGDAENAITVEPGETGELTYTFEEAGTVEIGCHQAGHYDAGMKINVEVS